MTKFHKFFVLLYKRISFSRLNKRRFYDNITNALDTSFRDCQDLGQTEVNENLQQPKTILKKR
jgi:hypothetical protein